MKKLNDVLLTVCQARHIPCIDLAEKLPRTSTMFYDDVHFNDQGSEAVSKVVYEALKNTGSLGNNPKKGSP